jgi:hypothetical protein
MVILLIGMALYFTIIVPCMCCVVLLILLVKKNSIKNSLFEKIKRNMNDIEIDYNKGFADIMVRIEVKKCDFDEKKNENAKKNEKGVKLEKSTKNKKIIDKEQDDSKSEDKDN